MRVAQVVAGQAVARGLADARLARAKACLAVALESASLVCRDQKADDTARPRTPGRQGACTFRIGEASEVFNDFEFQEAPLVFNLDKSITRVATGTTPAGTT